MGTKPRLLLLDAGAVFVCLRVDAWDAIVDAHEVVVPSIVVRVEGEFYVDQRGERIEIDLADDIARGRIREVSMSVSGIEAVKKKFTPDFRDRLHDGELEGLAYLLANPGDDIRFVTGDGPAIEAVAMLDEDARVLSLAEALDLCGRSKSLPHQFRREFVKRHLNEGMIRRIQGRGLSDV